MADVPAPPGGLAGSLPTFDELPLSQERREFRPEDGAALLAQLRQIEALERPDVEPAPAMPERWDDDERR